MKAVLHLIGCALQIRFATRAFHKCNSCVTRVSQWCLIVKGFCAIFRDKNAKNSKIGPFRSVTQVQLHPEVSPFPVTLVLHFECVFREVQHIFVLSLPFLSKVRLIKSAYYCILIHLIAYCAFFAFPVHKKRHRALHFCKARCPRFDRFPVSSSLPEPSSGSVRSGPGSWCCGTHTAYRPNVQ